MSRRFQQVLLVSLLAINGLVQTRGDSSPEREKSVEDNLRYATVIKDHPDKGMTLTEQMARLNVPGVSIAVIHDGRLDWAKGYGVSSLGGSPVLTSTLFSAASMSKPLTAMAVLRLVQEGKLDLDADVNSYLKSWRIPQNQYTIGHPVTIRELLNHTSGIGTHNGNIYDPIKGIPSVLQILDGQPPATTPPVRVERRPGTKFAYANGGYLILQLLISEITGKPFAEAMREIVLAPLGMDHSTFAAPLPADKVAIAATGYWEDGKTGISSAHFVEPNAAAGGLWTTAIDYAKFVIELQREYSGVSRLILDQRMARLMVTPGIGPSETYRWGLGVRVGGTAPKVFFEHGGSAAFQDDMVGYVSGEGAVVLTNGGGGGLLVDEIIRSVALTYHWPDFLPIERTTVRVNPSKFAGLLGTYDFMKVTQDGNRLMAEIPLGSPKQELIPESDTQYFLRDQPTQVIFDINADGTATGLEFITPMVHWHRNRTP